MKEKFFVVPNYIMPINSFFLIFFVVKLFYFLGNGISKLSQKFTLAKKKEKRKKLKSYSSFHS